MTTAEKNIIKKQLSKALTLYKRNREYYGTEHKNTRASLAKYDALFLLACELKLYTIIHDVIENC